MQFTISDKHAIHISFHRTSLEGFIFQLKEAARTHKVVHISMDAPLNYRGKKLKSIDFVACELGEYVSFENQCLALEIEQEIYDDLIIVLARALEEKGFRTPELMAFQAKTKTDCPLTLYAKMQ